jgi:Na+/pantothenate symporter
MRIQRNLGPLDRTLRFGLSAIFVYFGYFNHSVITDLVAGALLGTAGVILFVVAAVAWCPFYQLIDFNTLQEKP